MKNGIRVALAACAALLAAGGVGLWQDGALRAAPLAKTVAPVGVQASSGEQQSSSLKPPKVAETVYAMRYFRTAPGEFFIRIQSTPINDPMIK